MKLQTKLLIIFFEIAILPIVIIAFVGYTNSRTTLEASTARQLQSVASLQHNRVEAIFQRNAERLSLILSQQGLKTDLRAYLDQPTAANRAALEDRLRVISAAINDFQSATLVDDSGRAIASSAPGLRTRDFSGEQSFLQGRREQITTALSFENEDYVFELAGPVISGGDLLAVILLDVRATNFVEAMTDYTGQGETGETVAVERLPEDDSVRIISPLRHGNGQGLPVFNSSDDNVFAHVPEADQNGLISGRGLNGQEVLATVRQLEGTDWALVSVVDKAEALAPITNLRNLLIFLTAMTLLAVLAIAYTIARAISLPLVRLTQVTDRVSRGDLRQKITIDTGDELGQLARSFNSMTAQLRSLYGSLEDQVAQKTRELQASLADSEDKNRKLEDTKLAMLNLLEDLEHEKLTAEEQQSKSEAILRSIGDGVFAVDMDGTIILFNEAAEEITGLRADEAVGQPVDKVLSFRQESGREGKNDFIYAALSGNKASLSRHTVVERRDGSLVPVEDSAAPILDADSNIIGAIVVFRDVSRDRNLQRAKDEFIGLASHQLRTPATAVKNFIGLIKEGYAGELSPEQEQYIQLAYESNERQLDIVNDLLYVARTDSGQLNMRKEPGNIIELVGSILTEQSGTLKERGQKVVVNSRAGELIADYDPEHLRMVLENLISNASKYTPDGGRITIDLSEKAGKVLIGISDTGVGIDQSDLDRLFKKFSRIENKMSNVAGGSGIGLYLAKQIMDLHGGSITVKSKLGRGSTFTVELPKTSKE